MTKNINEIKMKILKGPWHEWTELPGSPNNYGWGNGYIGVPQGHPWYGKHYDDLGHVEVHGGLTYGGDEPEPESGSESDEILDPDSNLHWFGFDTAHFMDLGWEKEKVFSETVKLRKIAFVEW